MAGRTVVVQAFEVIFMAEGDTSGILGFYEERLSEIGRNGTRKGNNDSEK